MKTKLLVVGLLLCCFMVGLGATFQPENKKWEYQFEHIITPERANQLGDVGWELVTTEPAQGSPGHVQGIFKRARRKTVSFAIASEA